MMMPPQLVIVVCLLLLSAVNPTWCQQDAKNFNNETMPRLAKTDDGFMYVGRYCDRSYLLRPQRHYLDKIQTYIIKGNFLKTDTKMAFECTVVARLVDDIYDNAVREMKMKRGIAVGTTTPKPEIPKYDKNGYEIKDVPEIGDQNAVQIECEEMPVIKTEGTDDGCSYYIDINYGAQRYCGKGAKFKATFRAKNQRVILKAVSKFEAQNVFKGDKPSYYCKLKRVVATGSLDKWPPKIDYTPYGQPGFYFIEPCHQEIELTLENDVYVFEGPTQPFPGRTFLSCTKKIKVPPGYNVAVKASFQRLVEAIDVPACVSFYMVNKKEKFCQPRRMSGLFKPEVEDRVWIQIYSGAWDGSRFVVSKPLYEIRVVLMSSRVRTGYIITSRSGGQVETKMELNQVENTFEQTQLDQNKMSKSIFSQRVAYRPTSIEGVDACGGNIDLEKWGYVFYLTSYEVEPGKIESTFDCTWAFGMAASRRQDVTTHVAFIAEPMAVDTSQARDEAIPKECNAQFEVNGETVYCQPGNVMHGIFPLRNGLTTVRMRSGDGNTFTPGQPLWKVAVYGVYILKGKYWKKAEGTPYADETSYTVTAGRSANRITWFFGKQMKEDEKATVSVKVKIMVPKVAENAEIETMLYIFGSRANVKSVEKNCDCKYIVGGDTTFCATDDMNILKPLKPGQHDVDLEFTCTATFLEGNAFQARTSIHDTMSRSRVAENAKLTDADVIGRHPNVPRASTAVTFPPTDPPPTAPPSTPKPTSTTTTTTTTTTPPPPPPPTTEPPPPFTPGKSGMSVANFDEVFLRELSKFYLNDMVHLWDKMSPKLQKMKFGHVGTMAALGYLGHLGSVKVGRVVDLDVHWRFSYSHFGGIGDMPMELVKTLSGTGQLGVFDHLSLGQMVKLAQIGVLQRVSVGHFSNMFAMDDGLRGDIKRMAYNSKRVIVVNPDNEVDAPPGNPVMLTDKDIPNHAYHFPQVNTVYDMMTLIHLIENTVYEIRQNFSQQMEISTIPPPGTPTYSHPCDVDTTTRKLHYNINGQVQIVSDMLSKFDDNCEYLKLDEDSLDQVRDIQVGDLTKLLVGLSRRLLKGFVETDVLTSMRRVRVYVLTRIALGLSGVVKHILGNDGAVLFGKMQELMCASPTQLTDSIKAAQDADMKEEQEHERKVDEVQADSESMKVKITLMTSVYMMARLLGEPFNPTADHPLKDKFTYANRHRQSMRTDGDPTVFIEDKTQCEAVLKGEDGGAVKDDTLRKLLKVIAADLLVDLDAVDEEIPWMDWPRKVRLVHSLTGFTTGAQRSAGGDLNKIEPQLDETTFKISWGAEVLFSQTAQAWAMSLGGVLDPTLLSLGSNADDIGKTKYKTAESLVAPLCDYFSWNLDEVRSQRIAAPALEAIATFVNQYGNIGQSQMRWFTRSVLKRMKFIFHGLHGLVPKLEYNELVKITQIYMGSYFGSAWKSGAQAPVAKAIRIGLINVLNDTQVLALARLIYNTGQPELNHPNVLRTEPETADQLEDSLQSNPTKALGQLTDILGIRYLDDKFSKDQRARENPRPKAKVDIEKLSARQLQTLCDLLLTQYETLTDQMLKMVNEDQMSLGEDADVIQVSIGFLTANVVLFSAIWPDLSKEDTPGDYMAVKFNDAHLLTGGVAKLLFGVLVDVDAQSQSRMEVLARKIDTAIESGQGYKEAMEDLVKAMKEADPYFNDDSGDDFAAMAASQGRSITSIMDQIATRFYQYGKSRSRIETVLQGSLSSLAVDLKAYMMASNVDQLMRSRSKTMWNEKSYQGASQQRAIMRDEKERAGLSQNGFIFVTTENRQTHYSSFYDWEDMAEEAKEIIMSRLVQVLLVKNVCKRVYALAEGRQTEPITLDVDVPSGALGLHEGGNMTRVSVTIGRQEANSLFKKVQTSKQRKNSLKYKPFDQARVLGSEYQPKANISCIEWRQAAVKELDKNPAIFIPKCRPDGMYNQEQCDLTSALCWCVDHYGAEIGGTVTRLQKPDCTKAIPHVKMSPKSKRGRLVLSDVNSIPMGEIDEKEVIKAAEENQCNNDRELRLELYNNRLVQTGGLFIPKCDPDGSYAADQCDKDQRHCWCAAKDGRELPGTGLVGSTGRNCQETRDAMSRSDRASGQIVTWNYLFKVVRLWQQMVRKKMDEASPKENENGYKPNGLLVRLPATSGYPNSVMFLSKEKPNNATPSPYDVWVRVMARENPNFDANTYQMNPQDLKKLDVINVPDGRNGYQPTTIAAVLKTWPWLEDIYNQTGRSAQAFQDEIKSQDLDWKQLSTRNRGSGVADSGPPPGVVGAGGLDVRSMKKMCFCTRGTGKSASNKMDKKKEDSKKPGSKASKLDKSGDEKPDSISQKLNELIDSAGRRPGSAGPTGLGTEKAPTGTGELTARIQNANPLRLLMKVPIWGFCEAVGINWSAIAVKMKNFGVPFWFRFASIADMSVEDLEDALSMSLKKMHEDKHTDCGLQGKTGCMDPSRLPAQDVSGGQKAPDKVNIGGLCRILKLVDMNIGKMFYIMGIDPMKSVSRSENSLIHVLQMPMRILDAYSKKGIMGAVEVTKVEMRAEGNAFAQFARYIDRPRQETMRATSAAELPTALAHFFFGLDGPFVGALLNAPMWIFRLIFGLNRPSGPPSSRMASISAVYSSRASFIVGKATGRDTSKLPPPKIDDPAVQAYYSQTISTSAPDTSNGIIGYMINFVLWLIGVILNSAVSLVRNLALSLIHLVTRLIGMIFGDAIQFALNSMVDVLDAGMMAAIEPMLLLPRIWFQGTADVFSRFALTSQAVIQLWGQVFAPIILVIDPIFRTAAYVSGSASFGFGLELGANYVDRYGVDTNNQHDPYFRDFGEASGYEGGKVMSAGLSLSASGHIGFGGPLEKAPPRRNFPPPPAPKRLTTGAPPSTKGGGWFGRKKREVGPDMESGAFSTTEMPPGAAGPPGAPDDSVGAAGPPAVENQDTSLQSTTDAAPGAAAPAGDTAAGPGAQGPAGDDLTTAGTGAAAAAGLEPDYAEGKTGNTTTMKRCKDDSPVGSSGPSGEDTAGSDYKVRQAPNRPAVNTDGYRGKPPPGGFESPSLPDPVPDNSRWGKILNIPTFLVRAGGPIFMPICWVLSPLLRAIDIILYADGSFLRRFLRIPAMLAEAPGLISPIGAILQSLVPIVELVLDFMSGAKGFFGVASSLPGALKACAKGGLGLLFTQPFKIWSDMMLFFNGDDGVIGQILKFIRNGLRPDPLARMGAKSSDYWASAAAHHRRRKRETGSDGPPGKQQQQESKPSGMKPASPFGFGLDFVYGFVEDVVPIFSFMITVMNGVFGTIFDPRKVLTLLDLSSLGGPIMGLIKALLDPIRLYSLASDENLFLLSALGGQDPAALLSAGINPGKLLKDGLDPARFLIGGLGTVHEATAARLAPNGVPNQNEAKRLGFDEPKMLETLGIDIRKLYTGGLLEVQPDKLIDSGIDPFNLINRLIRNSVTNKMTLIKSGINFKKMLTSGIDPSMILCVGANGVNMTQWNKLKIDPSKTKDTQNFNKVGINGIKLQKAGIDVTALMEGGVDGMSNQDAQEKLGINRKKLLAAIYHGFDEKRMRSMGINPALMLQSGLGPLQLILSAPQLLTLDKEMLRSKGLDVDVMRWNGLNPSLMFAAGVTFEVPKMLLKIGCDPEMFILGLLSSLGLDALIGSSGDSGGSVLSILFQFSKIFDSLGIIGRLLHYIPIVGPMLFDAEGHLTGPLRIILFDLVGIDGQSGILGFIKRWVTGEINIWEVLKILNPVNIYNVVLVPLWEAIKSTMYYLNPSRIMQSIQDLMGIFSAFSGN